MKRVFIIHCWEGYPKYCWYPYVKKELEKNSFKVKVPAMPDTNKPKLSKWLAVLKRLIGKPDEQTFLVGHSVGCITILRYLESLAPKEKIGGSVLVAGYTDELGFKELKNFFTKPINFRKIKTSCENFIAIHSDNDPYVSLKYAGILKRKLGAKVIIKHKMSHFSGAIENEKSCIKLPDVVRSVIKLSKK